jgi:hypothetical protein
MTGQTDFTPEEWTLLLEGPPTAGMIVLTAQRGGTFRESIAMGKAYGEARQEHGATQLLDEITGTKPKVDRSHHHSVEELKQHGLEQLRNAAGVVRAKAAPDESDAYASFVLSVADKVANAHREDGVAVSPAERSAIEEIETALRGDAAAGTA